VVAVNVMYRNEAIHRRVIQMIAIMGKVAKAKLCMLLPQFRYVAFESDCVTHVSVFKIVNGDAVIY
jgi:hypothetical protein